MKSVGLNLTNGQRTKENSVMEEGRWPVYDDPALYKSFTIPVLKGRYRISDRKWNQENGPQWLDAGSVWRCPNFFYFPARHLFIWPSANVVRALSHCTKVRVRKLLTRLGWSCKYQSSHRVTPFLSLPSSLKIYNDEASKRLCHVQLIWG